MPVRSPKTTPNPTLIKALEKSRKGLSEGRPVQTSNRYIKSYAPSLLPVIKSREDLYITHCLDVKAEQYINFGLRAAVAALVNETSIKSSPLVTTAITINFNADFSDKIRRAVASKKPAQYFNHLFRSKIAIPFEIDDYIYVLEESSSGLLHVHIVCNIEVGIEKSVRKALWNSNWLRFDSTGVKSPKSVDIRNRYKVRMYRRALKKNDAELLDMEIETDPAFSLWECCDVRTGSNGKDYCAVYQAKEYSQINVGFADYLSKSISDKLFSGGKNYGMSRSLKTKMEPYIKQVISEGKEAGGKGTKS
ncbi:hypothetical protein [Paraglaciecola arctica]|uniref:hypothetical protein n=1 Tax=Paraglaciecola arctica TaxID=1128911 RepID=UPI001C074ED7|nr:hypothetical protein [Paraglaciecola arctica]MBU3005941.1 hypothetical protein [Paraglaciecola arctica]